MKNEILNKVSALTKHANLKLKKYSPEILMGLGIIGTVTSTVLACRATTKVGKIILSIKHFIERIDNSNEEKKNNDEYKHYVEEMYENNNFTQSEIEHIVGRIDKALCNSIK